jgi:phosphatidylinositol-3-phosphatase
MNCRQPVLVCAVVTLLSGCGGQTATTATSGAPATAGTRAPCGQASSRRVSYSHVVWLWMENHSYEEIVGSSSAPYLNSLARSCGLATNYHNITHPSLPNYIAATSGLGSQALQPFRGDCKPSAACSTDARSIFAQVPRWRAYEESMPAACDRQDSGDYAARHNPPPYYTSLTNCPQRDLPLTRLSSDLTTNSLPTYSFITPNLCHDTHDCPVSAGDQWLAGEVPEILDSRAYRAGHTVLFITWDEGEGGTASDCATNQSDVGCHVATVIVSPSTPAGKRSGQPFNHYSLLRTTEDLLGLSPLGQAAGASSMVKAFGLAPWAGRAWALPRPPLVAAEVAVQQDR